MPKGKSLKPQLRCQSISFSAAAKVKRSSGHVYMSQTAKRKKQTPDTMQKEKINSLKRKTKRNKKERNKGTNTPTDTHPNHATDA